MSIWISLALVFGALSLLTVLWIAFETVTAPVLDDELRVVSDPYHRVATRGDVELPDAQLTS
jgi:hypothetical protein